MPPVSIDVVLKWLGLLPQIISGGTAVYASVKAALAAHGIEAENAELDAVMADADRRKALALHEAGSSHE